MTIIVLGQCKMAKNNTATFVFKGQYLEHRITKINVYSNYEWKKGEDYVLHLKITKIDCGVLWTTLLKAKLI